MRRTDSRQGQSKVKFDFQDAAILARRETFRQKATIWDNLHKDTTFLDDLQEFSNETSAHGVKFIFESPGRIIRTVFFVFMLFMVSYALYTIGAKIVFFLTLPTGTQYTVVVSDKTNEKVQGIKFPTISVCSLNKVKKSYLVASENKLMKEYFEIVDLYNVKILEPLVKRLNDPDDGMSAIKNVTYESIIENGGPLADRMVKCEQGNRACKNLRVFEGDGAGSRFTMENSMLGRCWRVNPHGILRGKMGDYGALKIGFWADVQDYSRRTADQETHGFVVAFHDNETYGSTMFSGYLMSPGTYYRVGLKLKKMNWNELKKESCNASVGRTTYGSYNEGSCVLECKDRSLNDACGCVNILPPENNGKYRPCTLMEWASCGLPHYLDWYTNYTDTMREEPLCECDTPCEEIGYDFDISSSTLSLEHADSVEPSFGPIFSNLSNAEFNISYNTSQDILKNLMVMEVLFNSMQEVHISETISYDLGNLLGDIGGVLGLFLGASVFTVIESIIFLIVSISKYCCKRQASNWLK